MGNLHNYNPSETPYNFSDLTLVDKLMATKLLKFKLEVTDAYEKLDLQRVFKIIQMFVTKDVAAFYLDFSRDRLITRESS